MLELNYEKLKAYKIYHEDSGRFFTPNTFTKVGKTWSSISAIKNALRLREDASGIDSFWKKLKDCRILEFSNNGIQDIGSVEIFLNGNSNE